MSDVKRRIWYDPDADTLYSHVRQNVEPYLENNARWRDQEQKSDWGRRVASVPNVLVEQWLLELWNSGAKHVTLASPEFQAYMRKKLNSSEFAYLRTDRPTPAYRR
jgi:hypothetical protein